MADTKISDLVELLAADVVDELPIVDKSDVAMAASGSTRRITVASLGTALVAPHAAATTAVHGIANTSSLYRVGGTVVAIADGGTGASTAAGARTNLGLGTAIVSTSANYTALATDGVILVNTTAGTRTITLPALAAFVATGTTKQLKIVKASVDVNSVTVVGNGAEQVGQIGGAGWTFAVSTSFNAAGAAYDLWADLANSRWFLG